MGLWVACLLAGLVHYTITDPVVQMPVHGWNKIVIAAGWFGAGFAVSIVLAVIAWPLHRDSALRLVAIAPLFLQLLLVLVFIALVGAS